MRRSRGPCLLRQNILLSGSYVAPPVRHYIPRTAVSVPWAFRPWKTRLRSERSTCADRIASGVNPSSSYRSIFRQYQGGVISPLLSNAFLHHALDEWFVSTVAPRLRGRCQLVRYADDFLALFSDQRSCERFLAVLPKRLDRYGLRLHPAKTRVVDFRRITRTGHHPSATFDFLGFTHVWGRSRRGYLVVRQVTAKDRFARAVNHVFQWCKANRHQPLPDQQAYLARVIHGHCGYYGLTGNGKRLHLFRYEVVRAWRKALWSRLPGCRLRR